MRASKPIKRGKAPRKKTSARKMKQAVDLVVKQRIADRDGMWCAKCGKTESLQAAHILPKGLYPRMRFVTDNLLLLCLRCHLFWAHKDPLAFASWLNEKYPGLEQRLREMERGAPKANLKELYAEALNG